MITLHAKPKAPPWHPRYREAFCEGFAAHGYDIHHVVDTTPDDTAANPGTHVLFGPNYWPKTFHSAERVLCVDRCSVGNRNDFVTIGWDGWGGTGKYPEYMTDVQLAERWAKWHSLFPPSYQRQPKKSHLVILGEYPSACDDRAAIDKFYADSREVALNEGRDVYFRPHPHHNISMKGAKTSTDKDILHTAEAVTTYKTSFGVHCRLLGLPVAAGPASLAGHMLCHPDRDDEHALFDHWRNWLLFTQWNIEEIRSGEFWEYLKDAGSD